MDSTADRLLREIRRFAARGQIMHEEMADAFAELDAHLSAGGVPPEAWREGPDAPDAGSGYGWYGWEEDEERPDVYILTITDPDGEEYATIIHRACGGKYPLDGDVAQRKVQRAERIVAALNDLADDR